MSPEADQLHVALRPKNRARMRDALIVGGAATAMFLAVSYWSGWSAGSPWGLTFGIVSAVMMLTEVLYGLRRRIRVFPVKTAQAWLQWHVYVGGLAAWFVLIHTGFHWPNGTFGAILLSLAILTTVSGVIGVVLQKSLPVALASATRSEVIFEQIPDAVARLRAESQAVAAGTSDVLRNFVSTRLEPRLSAPAFSLGFLIDPAGGRGLVAADVEALRPFLGGTDHADAEKLRDISERKHDLDVHFTLQRVLRLWLVGHVPIALLLIAAVVIHILAVWWY